MLRHPGELFGAEQEHGGTEDDTGLGARGIEVYGVRAVFHVGHEHVSGLQPQCDQRVSEPAGIPVRLEVGYRLFLEKERVVLGKYAWETV
jgi:hypothetical protein